MPCSSDRMEQTAEEKMRAETATLLVYLLNKLGYGIDVRAASTSGDYWASKEDGDYVYAKLCKVLGSMNESELDKIVYDGRSRMSRRLADWWENHQGVGRREAVLQNRGKELELMAGMKASVKPPELIDEPNVRANNALVVRSGNRGSRCKITAFLYELMRDEVPPGVVERIVRNSQLNPGDEWQFCNGYLVQYAEDLADRLRPRG